MSKKKRKEKKRKHENLKYFLKKKKKRKEKSMVLNNYKGQLFIEPRIFDRNFSVIACKFFAFCC
jgi:hypothetical protein